jgi:hypothetical protein
MSRGCVTRASVTAHDDRRRDGGRAESGRCASGIRRPEPGRTHRTDDGRNSDERRRDRACDSERSRSPNRRRRHPHRRHREPSEPNQRRPQRNSRRSQPGQSYAASRPRRRPWRRNLRRLHRVVNVGGLLAPERVSPDRRRGRVGSAGRVSRGARAERNQLLGRTEPVSREVDYVCPRVFLFPAGFGVWTFVIHRLQTFCLSAAEDTSPEPSSIPLQWHQFVSIRRKWLLTQGTKKNRF